MDGRRIAALLGCALALVIAAPAHAAVDDAPALAAQGAGDMRMFVRGTDAAMWTRSWNGSSWSGWSSLGGNFSSGPVAMARPGGTYDVFARGQFNAYYHKFFTPAGGWSGSWERLPGGPFSSAPGATYRQGSGEVDVFGINQTGQLMHSYWQSGKGWAAFASLGGYLSGRPSVVSPRPGDLDVFMRGADKVLYQKSWVSGSGWTDFFKLGAELKLTSGPSATSWNETRRDIMARGADGAVYMYIYQAPNWQGWQRLGGTPTTGPGGTSSGPTRLEIAYRSREFIHYKTYHGGWSGWSNLGRAPLFKAPPPPAAVPVPGPPPAELRLRAGFGCIPVGGRVPVRIRVYARNEIGRASCRERV